MRVQPGTLINALPPFARQRDVIIWGRQKMRDIIKEMLAAHTRWTDHYDIIAPWFTFNAPRELFNFLRKNCPYLEEPDNDQTTKSPAAILQSDNDCKHYALFVGGILDALNRQGYDFDWCYRFCKYSEDEKTYNHVYVICNDVWIDPTPIKDKDTGNYYPRSYNDRLALPFKYDDIKPSYMLSSIHGVHYNVVDEDETTACAAAGIGQATVAQANALVSKAGQAATGLAALLPDSGLKEFLKNFTTDPVGTIVSLITGRTFTSGDYHLGEIYMRNILGMSQIQKRGQVPDEYVPQAWAFFTYAMGVPISSHDHLVNLAQSAEAYKAWANNFFGWVPIEQARRASTILTQYIGWTAAAQDAPVRDVPWPLAKFGAIPYIYPMWGVYDGKTQKKFTGTHPILNIVFDNGYPYQATTTQPVTEIVTPAPADQTPTTTTPTTTTTTTTPTDNTPTPKQAGMSTAQIFLIAAVAGGVLYAANQPKSKRS